MQVLTYDEMLTKLCDDFDSLISPKVMARSNTNIIYLMFKAIAKGMEIINNICVVLDNKFDPQYCSSEDLASVASLVGTERYRGSASGLHIVITNDGDNTVTLLAGTYYYALDDDTRFEFEVQEDTDIDSGEAVSFIAMSEEIGSFHVTRQTSITVESEETISDDLNFSCTDNASLLGIAEETDLEFRKRINTDATRQDTFSELETRLKNLPYIFDCKVKFNNTVAEVEYGNYTLPAYTLAIFFSGEIKNEIAEIVCDKIICPTLATSNSVEVDYNNEVFIDGKHTVNLIPFDKMQYGVELIYKIDKDYVSEDEVKDKIRNALYNAFVSERHTDYVKEDDYYNVIEALDLSGVELLGINLKFNGANVNYIPVPASSIPELSTIIFTSVQE